MSLSDLTKQTLSYIKRELKQLKKEQELLQELNEILIGVENILKTAKNERDIKYLSTYYDREANRNQEKLRKTNEAIKTILNIIERLIQSEETKLPPKEKEELARIAENISQCKRALEIVFALPYHMHDGLHSLVNFGGQVQLPKIKQIIEQVIGNENAPSITMLKSVLSELKDEEKVLIIQEQIAIHSQDIPDDELLERSRLKYTRDPDREKLLEQARRGFMWYDGIRGVVDPETYSNLIQKNRQDLESKYSRAKSSLERWRAKNQSGEMSDLDYQIIFGSRPPKEFLTMKKVGEISFQKVFGWIEKELKQIEEERNFINHQITRYRDYLASQK